MRLQRRIKVMCSVVLLHRAGFINMNKRRLLQHHASRTFMSFRSVIF